MKKGLVFLLFSFIFAYHWTVQNPPVRVNFYSIHFPVDTLIGYACGERGTIIKTTNGGQTWFLLSAPLPVTFYGCYFVNQNLGYVCGANGVVLKTTNGGQDWQNLSTGVTDSLYHLYFISPDTGFIVGENSRVLRTYNGGARFDRLSASITPVDLKGINVFANGQIAYACGEQGKIFKTTNYGVNWTSLNSQSQANLSKLSFINENLGYICSDSGYVLKTTDGGNNFTRLDIVPGRPLYGIHFLTPQIGYVCGIRGMVLKTTDGGQFWEIENTGIGDNLYYIFFKTEEVGWACGEDARIIKRSLFAPALSENKKEKIKILENNTNIFLPTGQILKNNKLNKGIYFIKNNRKFKKIIKI